MFGLGPMELALILVLVLVIFGAGRLPQVFGSMGKGIKEFRDAAQDGPSRPETPAAPDTPKSA